MLAKEFELILLFSIGIGLVKPKIQDSKRLLGKSSLASPWSFCWPLFKLWFSCSLKSKWLMCSSGHHESKQPSGFWYCFEQNLWNKRGVPSSWNRKPSWNLRPFLDQKAPTREACHLEHAKHCTFCRPFHKHKSKPKSKRNYFTFWGRIDGLAEGVVV